MKSHNTIDCNDHYTASSSEKLLSTATLPASIRAAIDAQTTPDFAEQVYSAVEPPVTTSLERITPEQEAAITARVQADRKQELARRRKANAAPPDINEFIKEIVRQAEPYIESICAAWLPDGKRKGHDWVALNPTRADNEAGSFSVSLIDGSAYDHATPEFKGTGDIVSTVRYLDGLATQLDAARRVADFIGATPLPDIKPTAKKPTPKPMATMPTAHPSLGKPSAQYEYRAANGDLLGMVMRFNQADGAKEFRPLFKFPDGWYWKAPAEPRPLYGLDRLAARPDAPVLVCEGEKATNAAVELFPDCACIASMNGAQSPNKSDWSLTKGRDVFIWPDADSAGADYARTVARLALAAGAQSVAIADLASIATLLGGSELPKGWDAADALAEGWTDETARSIKWTAYTETNQHTLHADSTNSTTSTDSAGYAGCAGSNSTACRLETRANAGNAACAGFSEQKDFCTADAIHNNTVANAADVITAAIADLSHDGGAVLTPAALDAWTLIHGNDGALYERLRTQAKRAKARVSVIDQHVKERAKAAHYARSPRKNVQDLKLSSTPYTSSTDKGSIQHLSSTNPTFKPALSSTDPTQALHDGYRALVKETEKGPKLAIASEAALTVSDVFRGRFAYCQQAEMWHQFTGSHWEPLLNAAPLYKDFTRWLFSATDGLGFTPRYQDSVLTVIQRGALNALPDTPQAIPFANGLLDMQTMQLQPVTPDTAATWSLPYEYLPDAECPRVKAWLLETVGGDAEVVELLRAFLAALLRGGAYLQRFLHLIGPGGTGKSTLLRLIEALVGSRNTVTTDLKELEQNRFESAALYGKRAALITDSDRYGGAVNKLKAITGQDPVRLERKNVQQNGSFTFGGMVFLASNEALATTDYTSGIERRRVTVHFDRRVSEEEKARWSAMGGEKAVLHAELPGVVNWVLSMPIEEMERRIRNPPEHTVKANLEAMCAGNPCADWLIERCAPDKDVWTQIGVAEERRSGDGEVFFLHADSRLFPNYLDWCKKSGRVPLSLRRFRSVVVDAIRTLGYDVTDSRKAQGNGLTGVRLRPEYEAPYAWHEKPTAAPIRANAEPERISVLAQPETDTAATPASEENSAAPVAIPPPLLSAPLIEHERWLDAIGADDLDRTEWLKQVHDDTEVF